ncbi:hypothetical protein [Synechocystis sp. PCC 7509]|uniref:hypothetical protein n=1 Tax=Synechocystis sp. PCC 7509 TaxID=927677 RepID=UPI00048E9D49|nr:hypothetical protein [Synechocystis sp. PCC 7509]
MANLDTIYTTTSLIECCHINTFATSTLLKTSDLFEFQQWRFKDFNNNWLALGSFKSAIDNCSIAVMDNFTNNVVSKGNLHGFLPSLSTVILVVVVVDKTTNMLIQSG